MELICPRCNKPFAADTQICSNCGLILGAATHQIGSPVSEPRSSWGTQRFSPGGTITLRIADKSLKVNILDRTTLVLGRKSPDTVLIPDIDLDPYDAYVEGVSRAHAKFIIADGKFYVEDIGSANGTQINGERLSKGERRTLKDGDTLMLARLSIQVFF